MQPRLPIPHSSVWAAVTCTCTIWLAACGSDPAAVRGWLSGSLTPPDSPTTIAARHFAQQVTDKTNGRILIQHFDSSQLGTGQQQIEALALGTQHLYFGSGSAPSILLPQYGVIDIAFLFRDRAHFDRFLASDLISALNQQLLNEFNVRVLAMNWYRKPRYLLHSGRFITDPASMEGARARSPNLPMFLANWAAVGAVPVKVSFFEQYLALSQGLVELTEASGDDIYPMRLHEVAPFITEADMMFPQASAYVAERAFRELGPADQRIVIEAARAAGDLHTRLVNDRFDSDRLAMIKEGARFAPLPADAKRAFLSLVRRRAPQLEAEGLIPMGWFDRIQAMQ